MKRQLTIILLILCSSVSLAIDVTDSDGDLHPDAFDNCTLEPNFDQRDDDQDGYGNRCDGDLDNSGFVDSFDQQLFELILTDPFPFLFREADFNVDDQVDLLDAAILQGFLGFPPGPSLIGDLDYDGTTDSTDNCPLTYNPDQADFDSNNVGDACDDQDADGVFDASDNCIFVANTAQTDGDEDGYGNICDSDLNNDGAVDVEDRDLLTGLLGTSDLNADLNSDGIVDSLDQALLEAAFGLPPGPSLIGDIDFDGILDSADNCISAPNANQMDLDGDGIGAECDLDEVLVTVGNEMQVNDFSTGTQNDPAIAANGMDNYVVVWTGRGIDSVQNDIYARIFNALGEPQDNAFKVNTTDSSTQSMPSVAMGSQGDFVITWRDTISSVFAQQYDSNGNPFGTEIQVSATSDGNKYGPAIAMDENGGFMVVWDDNGPQRSAWDIYARLFDEDGTPQGDGFKVNTSPRVYNTFSWRNYQAPAVSYSPISGYVIGWSGIEVAGTNDNIYMRQYSVSGSSLGAEANVTTSAQHAAGYTTIDHDSTGDFTIAWSGAETGIESDIFARMFSVNGVASSDVFRVNTYTLEDQWQPKISMGPEGNFIIVWQSWEQNDDWDVFAQRYDIFGQSDGGEFQVNSYSQSWQDSPDVVLDSDGNFIVVWDSRGQDGSLDGVYSQHFGIDSDRDSLLDINDNCPATDFPLDTIEIQTCDSGIQDVMLSDPLGCSIQDQILMLANDAKSHGQFVSRVDKFLLSLQKADVLEPNERRSIKACAAQSDLPE
jgi:hypothetical protein